MEHKMAFCFKPNCIICVLSVSWEDSVSTRFLAIEVESESLVLDRTRRVKLQGQVRHNAISFSNQEIVDHPRAGCSNLELVRQLPRLVKHRVVHNRLFQMVSKNKKLASLVVNSGMC